MGSRCRTGRLEFLDATHDDFDRTTSFARQDRGHRFEVDRNLTTKSATDFARRHRHLRHRQAQDLSGLALHYEGALCARPDVEMAIFVPQRRGVVWLDIALM